VPTSWGSRNSHRAERKLTVSSIPIQVQYQSPKLSGQEIGDTFLGNTSRVGAVAEACRRQIHSGMRDEVDWDLPGQVAIRQEDRRPWFQRFRGLVWAVLSRHLALVVVLDLKSHRASSGFIVGRNIIVDQLAPSPSEKQACFRGILHTSVDGQSKKFRQHSKGQIKP
jgi:hypothetical protein